MTKSASGFYPLFVKRWFDMLFAIVLMVVLSPLFLCIVLVLSISQRGQVFFIQLRPGLNEKPFRFIKFRTMDDAKDEEGKLLDDSKRVTTVGKWLRKTGLDELPQLWNVLVGDMSFVGPRPWLMEYLPLYSREQRKRFQVKPGITGWAQIKGRNAVGWASRFEYDEFYVLNQSFLLDLRIIWLTLLLMFSGKGRNKSATDPMPPFQGQNP